MTLPHLLLRQKRNLHPFRNTRVNRELFEGLAFNPGNNSNSLKVALMMEMEDKFASEKSNKSSAKQR